MIFSICCSVCYKLTNNPVPILAPIHEQLPFLIDEDSRLVAGDRLPFLLLIQGEVTKIFAKQMRIY